MTQHSNTHGPEGSCDGCRRESLDRAHVRIAKLEAQIVKIDTDYRAGGAHGLDPNCKPMEGRGPWYLRGFESAARLTRSIQAEHQLKKAQPVIAVLDALATKRAECTGAAASWCPICGDCICGELREHGEYLYDCPLHGTNSRHAEEEPDPNDAAQIILDKIATLVSTAKELRDQSEHAAVGMSCVPDVAWSKAAEALLFKIQQLDKAVDNLVGTEGSKG